MQKKHTTKLSEHERSYLQRITRSGEHKTRVITRARILLKSHQGLTDQRIVEHLNTSRRTVQRVRKRYATDGINGALYDAPRPGGKRKLTDKAEAHLVAVACSEPPPGTEHWTLELLQQRLVNDGVVDTISTVTIWQQLTDRGVKPWREKNVVHSHSDR